MEGHQYWIQRISYIPVPCLRRKNLTYSTEYVVCNGCGWRPDSAEKQRGGSWRWKAISGNGKEGFNRGYLKGEWGLFSTSCFGNMGTRAPRHANVLQDSYLAKERCVTCARGGKADADGDVRREKEPVPLRLELTFFVQKPSWVGLCWLLSELHLQTKYSVLWASIHAANACVLFVKEALLWGTMPLPLAPIAQSCPFTHHSNSSYPQYNLTHSPCLTTCW